MRSRSGLRTCWRLLRATRHPAWARVACFVALVIGGFVTQKAGAEDGHASAGDAPSVDVKSSARSILQAAFDQRRPQSVRNDMTMRLVEGGREWTRDCVLFARRRTTEESDQLFRFTTPPDLAGSAVLTRENRGGEDDQWVYLPAYHMVRRVAAGNRGDAYLGTDYFYEDVLDPRWDEYDFKVVGREVVERRDCVRIEGVPTADRLKSATAYSRTVYWVEPRQKLIVKQEFFDKGGRLLKRLRNSDLKSYGRYLLWDHSEMENVQTGHKTVTRTKSRQVDQGLADEVFSQKALKRGG